MKHFATALSLLAGANAIRSKSDSTFMTEDSPSASAICSRFEERSSNSAFKTLQSHLSIHCSSMTDNEDNQSQAQWRASLKAGIETNNLDGIACTLRSILGRLQKDCEESRTAKAGNLAIQSSVLNTPLHEDASEYADPPLAYALETIVELKDKAILPPALWLIAAGADGSQKLKSETTYLELAKTADDSLSQDLSHVILEALIYGQTGGYNADNTISKLSSPTALLADAQSRLKELALEESILFYKMVQAAKYKISYSTRPPALKDASHYLVDSVLPGRCSAAKELAKINPNSGLAEYGLRLLLAIEVENDQASVEQIACTLLTLGKQIDSRTGEFLHAAQLNFQEPKTNDTPLHKAARLIANSTSLNTQKRGTIIIAMLLAAGASPTLVNKKGLTPLEVLFKGAPKQRKSVMIKKKNAAFAEQSSESVNAFVALVEGAAKANKKVDKKATHKPGKKGALKPHVASFVEQTGVMDAGDKAILLELLNSHALDQATFIQLQSAAADLDLLRDDPEDDESEVSEDNDDVGSDKAQVNLAAGFLIAYGGNFSSGFSMRGVVNYDRLGTSEAQILSTLNTMEKKFLKSDATLERDLLMQALPALLKATETVPGTSLNRSQDDYESSEASSEDVE